MIPESLKKRRKVTDKNTKDPTKMTDLTLDEAILVSDTVHSGAMWEIRRLLETLKAGQYSLNKWEIEAMDRLIREYNLKYKSPLAKALEETK